MTRRTLAVALAAVALLPVVAGAQTAKRPYRARRSRQVQDRRGPASLARRRVDCLHGRLRGRRERQARQRRLDGELGRHPDGAAHLEQGQRVAPAVEPGRQVPGVYDVARRRGRRRRRASQVWLLNRSGGEAQKLTDIKGGVDDFEWSPDSTRLVLVVSDPDPSDDPEKIEGWKKKTKPPIVIDRYQFKRDYAGYLQHLRDHLYLFDIATKKAEPLTSGDYDDRSPSWSPDGTRDRVCQQARARPRSQPRQQRLRRRRQGRGDAAAAHHLHG